MSADSGPFDASMSSSESLGSSEALCLGADEILRHWLATLYYRAGLALNGTDDTFAHFHAGSGTRSAHELLSHVIHVTTYVLREFDPKSCNQFFEHWSPTPSNSWRDEIAAFRELVTRCDQAIQDHAIEVPAKLLSLVQGPFADAMTHVGQLSLLRRLAGNPIQGRNFMRAEIRAGVFPPIE